MRLKIDPSRVEYRRRQRKGFLTGIRKKPLVGVISSRKIVREPGTGRKIKYTRF